MPVFPLLLALLPTALDDTQGLPAPELLRDVAGDPIDLSSGYGHSGPLVLDMDGEAPLDLMVGDLKGHLHVYLGRKTDAGTRYESKGPLARTTPEGSEPIRVHNW